MSNIPYHDYEDDEEDSHSFGEMRGMTDWERDNWNGGYGPGGAWWDRENEDE